MLEFSICLVSLQLNESLTTKFLYEIEITETRFFSSSFDSTTEENDSHNFCFQ